MELRYRKFKTEKELEAFLEGVEFVNDSALEEIGRYETHQGEQAILFSDTDGSGEPSDHAEIYLQICQDLGLELKDLVLLLAIDTDGIKDPEYMVDDLIKIAAKKQEQKED